MARISLSVLFLLFIIPITFAQKFGFVDMNYILTKIPEYSQAQSEIDKLAKGWEEEIQQLYNEIATMEASFKAEEILLTVDMKNDRRTEIDRKMKELKEHK